MRDASGLSERLVSGLLGAVFGAAIGLGIAWLLMFSATLHLSGIGHVAVSPVQSAIAGALFFGVAGLVLGASVGGLIGLVLVGIFRFQRLYDGHDRPWRVQLLIAAVGIAMLLWVNGVFTA